MTTTSSRSVSCFILAAMTFAGGILVGTFVGQDLTSEKEPQVAVQATEAALEARYEQGWQDGAKHVQDQIPDITQMYPPTGEGYNMDPCDVDENGNGPC